VVGCAIENGTAPGHNFREVLVFNPSIITGIPHINLSIACNHCQSPPCVAGCPAGAVEKDPGTGIVELDGDLCLGCAYCSWVCPFGAPVYDTAKGVMTKCDLCSDRISEGLKPACASVCPTGALRAEILDPETAEQHIPFFPDSEALPASSIGKTGKMPPAQIQFIDTYPEEVLAEFTPGGKGRVTEVSLWKEWPLLVFTLLVSVLGSVFASFFLTGRQVDPVVFGTVGMAGILISLKHLGKTFRSFRIIVNFAGSWLSRESVFFALFLLSALFSLSGTLHPYSGIAGMVSIFLTAVSADMIYVRSVSRRSRSLHSAQVSITLILFVCAATGFTGGVVLVSLIKMFLYLRRKTAAAAGSGWQVLLSVLRLVPGLLLPVFLILLNGYDGFIVPLLFLLGELLDRSEFYREFNPVTPAILMEESFNPLIRENVSGRSCL